LREAVNQASVLPNTYPQGLGPEGLVWRINFDPALAGQTILLSTVGDADAGPSALLVANNMTIDGTTAPGLTIARDPAGPPMRLFRVLDITATLRGFTLRGGLALGDDG